MFKFDKKLLFLIVIIILAGILIRMFLPQIYFEVGKKYLDKGEFLKASQKIGVAMNLVPSDSNYKYYYVKSLISMKPTYEIEKEVYSFANSKKDDSAKRIAQDKVNEWKLNINRNAGNNYIERTPYNFQVLRWNKDSFPLKVYMSSDMEIPSYYKSGINKSLKVWANNVDFIDFVVTNSKDDADIIIDIQDKKPDMGSDMIYVVAYTTPVIDKHFLKYVEIILYRTKPDYSLYNEKEIYNAMSHEIGHALGIMGHSDNSSDLMYMAADNDMNFINYRDFYTYLTTQDINTVKLLYSLMPDITDKPIKNINGLVYAPIILGDSETMIKAKIKEAEAYIQSSPEVANGYINLASAYSEQGNIKKSTELLKKALKITSNDDERAIIYYNMAIDSYKNNDKKKALEYANKSKQYKVGEDVDRLINNIENNK